jgi:hypothetical protein
MNLPPFPYFAKATQGEQGLKKKKKKKKKGD